MADSSSTTASANTVALPSAADRDTETSEANQPVATLYEQALNLLRPHTSDLASAQQALEATTSDSLQNAARWADEAAVWLACTNEMDTEQKAMGEAMQESLMEAESEQALQIPVDQLETEKLKLRYGQSRILKQVQEHVAAIAPALWEPPCRQHLLPLLELELKACKWYPSHGTYAYMNQVGEHFATSMLPVSTGHDAGSIAPAATGLTAAKSLQHHLQELQSVLYAMPETSGAAPNCFTALEPPEDDMVVSEVPADVRQVACVDLV